MFAVRSILLFSPRSHPFLVLLATAALLLGVLQLGRAPRADALGLSLTVDEPSSYDQQTTCTSGPRPGTVALAHYLLRAFPVTHSMGMMRDCWVGARSEHKDGRAFDWGADVARASTKQAAFAFLHAALATDSAGNAHALARRLGIMYVIYNDTIWSSYRDFAPRAYLNAGCSSKAKCSRTLRHLDHVHISLGFAGAAAQTSWYRTRNVPSQPVLYPGTHELDPDNTAVTGFRVPATGGPVSSAFLLRAGVTYRVVVSGAIRLNPTTLGDAQCAKTADGYVPTDRGPLLGVDPGTGWGDWGDGGGSSAGSDHADSPYAQVLPTTRGLVFGNALRWEGGCRLDHTYQAWYTPSVTSRLRLAYVDATASDNSGSFSVYVARDDITLASLERAP